MAVEQHNVRSFADLGACFGVHAGYTLDLLNNHNIDGAYVVDGRVTPLSRKRGENYPQLHFVSGLLGDPAVAAQVPDVDALLMFAILLHQVSPSWDEFLEMWCRKTRVVVIFNQMWKRDAKSLRLISKGKDWYLENVYHKNNKRGDIDLWFSQHGTVNRKTGRKAEDTYKFWQWGITTEDLINHMIRLGFMLEFREDYGPFPFGNKPLPWFHDEGFIFVRK
jgi:hypothetical protein